MTKTKADELIESSKKAKEERDKELLVIYKTALTNIFNKCLANLPKEMIIELLKKKKIIKRNWEEKGEVYVEVTNDK